MQRTTVGELMTRDVVTLSQEQAVPAAQELIRMLHIRHLPVVSSDGALIGLVTQRQLLAAHALLLEQLGGQGSRSGTDLELTIPVSKVMETDVQRVSPGTAAVDALELMLEKKIGSLPVVEEGRVVGIVTSRDFLTFELKKLRSGEHEAAPPPAPVVSQPARAVAPWMLVLPVLLTLALAGFLVYREVTRPPASQPAALAPTSPDTAVRGARLDRGSTVEGAAAEQRKTTRSGQQPPLPLTKKSKVPAKPEGATAQPGKTEAKKTEAKKTEVKKTEAKKTEAKKTEAKKTEARKTEPKPTEPKGKKEQPWIPEPIPKTW